MYYRCRHCQQDLPGECFHRDRSRASGMSQVCKECKREETRSRQQSDRAKIERRLRYYTKRILTTTCHQTYLEYRVIIEELRAQL